MDVSAGITIAAMAHDKQKATWGGKEGGQDRNSNRAGTWRQELMQRPWRGADYWLAQPAFL